LSLTLINLPVLTAMTNSLSVTVPETLADLVPLLGK